VHIIPIEVQFCVLLYLSMHVIYCALCIGFLYDIMIGCILVPFHCILVVDVLPFYDYVCYAKLIAIDRR
jgi:hypothetical protein